MKDVFFSLIKPDKNYSWLNQSDNDFDELIPIASKTTKSSKIRGQERAIFKLFSMGVITARDDWVYDIDPSNLQSKVSCLIGAYNHSIQSSEDAVPDGVEPIEIKWSRAVKRDLAAKRSYDLSDGEIVSSDYRPFTRRSLYYSRRLNEMVNQTMNFAGSGRSTPYIAALAGSRLDFGVLAGNRVPNYATFSLDPAQNYPRYRYAASGDRLDNITDWAVKQFAARYGTAAAITKDDIFAYVYAVLHDPAYRETYALNLKREFPRIPLYPDFRKWCDWGQRLLDLHIGYEAVAPFALTRTDTPDPKRAEGTTPAVKLKSDAENGVVVLDADTQLSGVPTEAWRYRLGNRSAIDWVLDQHKEKTPKDPTIREKFNTYRFADYKETVVDLLARVVTVSVETVAITDAMAALPPSAREQKKADA